jgi:hypothetical protein
VTSSDLAGLAIRTNHLMAYKGKAAKGDSQRRGPGPPLPDFGLNEPKTVPSAPEQKAEVVSILIVVIAG